MSETIGGQNKTFRCDTLNTQTIRRRSSNVNGKMDIRFCHQQTKEMNSLIYIEYNN